MIKIPLYKFKTDCKQECYVKTPSIKLALEQYENQSFISGTITEIDFVCEDNDCLVFDQTPSTQNEITVASPYVGYEIEANYVNLKNIKIGMLFECRYSDRNERKIGQVTEIAKTVFSLRSEDGWVEVFNYSGKANLTTMDCKIINGPPPHPIDDSCIGKIAHRNDGDNGKVCHKSDDGSYFIGFSKAKLFYKPSGRNDEFKDLFITHFT